MIYGQARYETHYSSAILVGHIAPHRGTDTHPDKHHLRPKKKKDIEGENFHTLQNQQAFPRRPYRCYESHLVAGQPPLTVQVGAQDTEDHHLHGVCYLLSERRSTT